MCGIAGTVRLDGAATVEDRELVSRMLRIQQNRGLALSASEQSWATPDEAPGTDKVKLRRVGVVPEFTGDDVSITVETPFRIEVEFWNFAPAQLNTAMEVYNIEEVCVFSSYSNPGPYPAGVVKTICHVPGNFLNNSIYSVRIFIVRDVSTHLLCHNSLMFEVHDVERAVAYYGKWLGAVRPILSWKVEVSPADEVLAGVEAS